MKISALVSAVLLVAGLAVAKAEQPSKAPAKSAPAKVKVQTPGSTECRETIAACELFASGKGDRTR
jgi:hypothetical protein